jgi:hypothetical protein
VKIPSPVLIAGAAALAITMATAAIASEMSNHREITVQLPDGGTERIEYPGEAPQIVIGPAPLAWPWREPDDFWAPRALTSLERMSAYIDR